MCASACRVPPTVASGVARFALVAKPRRILDREVVFFGGKGGVGKTTLAATMALQAAREGLRTLLVSTDPAHSTSDVFETRLGGEAREVRPGLWALEIDPSEEADRYIEDVKARIAESTPPRLMAEVERQIDIARVTPGAEESALFDRFTRIALEAGDAYDRLLFDTAPLGHTLRLLALPELMGAWISGLISRRKKVNVLGRMWRNVAGAAAGSEDSTEDPVLRALQERQTRFRHARTLITDPHRTGFVFVVTPEHLPVAETERSVRMLDKYGIPVAAILLNQVIPAGVGETLLAARRERQQEYAARVRKSFSAYPVHVIPLIEGRMHGLESLERLAQALPMSERAM